MGMTQREESGISGLLNRSLRMQLRLFIAIFAIMVVLIVVHLVQDHLNPLWALAGFVPGLAIGVVLARTKVLRWEPSQREVVGSMDAVGSIILVAYFVFLFFRSRIIGREVESAAVVSVIGLAITAGAMLGRVYFTMRGVRNILRVAAGAGPKAPTPER
jgi:hypothetical protein